METSVQDSDSTVRRTRLFGVVFAIALIVLVIGVYPLGLLPQTFSIGKWHNNLSFALSIPVFLTLGLLAIPVIVTERWRVAKPLFVGLIIYVASWAINFPRHTEFVDEFVRLLGCVTIPLAAAILRERKVLTAPRLGRVGLIIWSIQLSLGFVALFTNQPLVGTPGNPNWMAAFLLALAPWAAYGLILKHEGWNRSRKFTIIFLAHVILIPAFKFKKYVSYFETHRMTLVLLFLTLALIFAFFKLRYPKPWITWMAASVTVGVPTLFLLYACHSRAAWLALFGTLILLIFVVLKTRLEKSLYGGILVILSAGALFILIRFFPLVLLDVIEPDVRLPLWSGTVAMMVDHPTGVRPGEFQRTFVKYRIGTYHSRLVAADMTVHPHNEFLNLGAQLGFSVLIALILMALPLLGGTFDDLCVNLARLSALVIVVMSCFDMPLVQPPVSVMGYLMLGLCWPLTLKPGPVWGGKIRWLGYGSLAGATIASAVFIWYDLVHDVHFRKGTIAKHVAQGLEKAGRPKAAKEHFHLASDHFLKAITPVNSLKPQYEVGLLKMKDDATRDQAEEYFLEVQALDPAYAHLNMLLGQYYFKRKEFAKAHVYFMKECHYYLKNTGVWQNMYSFSYSSGQYGLAHFCDAKLRELYLEKAHRTYRGDRLTAKRRMFLEALEDENRRDEAIRRGKEMAQNVSLKVIDPLMHVLTLDEQWYLMLEGGYERFDYLLWKGRYKKYQALRKAFPERAPDVAALTEWFCKRYTMTDSKEFSIPATTSRSRRGGPDAIYACFSDYLSIIGGRSVIQLDDGGTPELAWVFYGPLGFDLARDLKAGRLVQNPTVDVSLVRWYKVDLKAAHCEEMEAKQARAAFKWIPNRTTAYFAPEEYFFRTQILGTILAEEAGFLPTRPPSIRLLELFFITGNQPPNLFSLKDYCFQAPLEVYKTLFLKSVEYARAKEAAKKAE